MIMSEVRKFSNHGIWEAPIPKVRVLLWLQDRYRVLILGAGVGTTVLEIEGVGGSDMMH